MFKESPFAKHQSFTFRSSLLAVSNNSLIFLYAWNKLIPSIYTIRLSNLAAYCKSLKNHKK